MSCVRNSLLACGLLLAGCTEAPAPVPAVEEPVRFRYVMEEAPSGFDPLKAGLIYASAVVLATHDTLYRYQYLKRPYALVPNLAAELPQVSADGLKWTVKLRPGVHFVDDPAFPGGKGRELLASDVEYSFKRHFHPDNISEGSWLWQEQLAGIEAWRAAGADYDAPWEAVVAVAPHTVEFRLRKPYAQLPYTLVQAFSAIVAREAVEKYGADLALHPVGSGPFILQGFDGAVARLRRNPGYRQEAFALAAEGYEPALHGPGFKSLEGRSPPFVDELEIHFLSDARVSLAAFERGETDLTSVASELHSQVLAQATPLQLTPAFAECCQARLEPMSELVYMAFNFADPVLGHHPDPARDAKQRSLRCAIAKAYDWRARNRQFNAGVGQVFAGFIPPSVPEFDPQLSGAHADPEAARVLLQSQGWRAEQLPTLRFASTGGLVMQQIFEQLRSDLVGIGWPAERIEWQSFPSFGAYNTAVNSGQLMLMDLGWRLDYPDALNTLQLFYGPYAPPQVNAGAWKNARFDQWFEQAQGLPPGPERTALSREMNQLLIDDCVGLAGFSRASLFAWRKHVIAFPDREMLGGHFLKFVALDGASNGD